MKGPLSVPGFRRLTIGWTFSNFGDSALYLTLAIWVKDLTGSDASAGLVFLFLGLPAFLAPLAGQIADRFPRRPTIAISNVVAGLGVLSLAFVESKDQLWLIYLVAFGYGLITYLTAACGSALVKDLVDDEHLAAANGLLSSLDQGLRLLSPLAGAGLYVAFGGGALAVLTASTLVIAAVIVMTVRVEETVLTSADERAGFWTEVVAGVAHMRRTPPLGRLTLWLAVAIGITGFVNSVIFAFIDQGLGKGSGFFAVIGSLQGVGAVAGGLTAAWIIGKLGEAGSMALGLVVIALGLSALFTTSTIVAIIGATAAGVGIPWAVVAYITVRQRLTPGTLQGRVAAAGTLAMNAPQTIATAIGAGLVAFVDYRILVAVMVVTLVASAGMVRGARPESIDTDASGAAGRQVSDAPAR